MSEQTIKPIDNKNLMINENNRPENNPAIVYLSSLTRTGRASQIQALNKVAELMGVEQVTRKVERANSKDPENPTWRDENITYQAIPWEKLEYQHIQAIRSKLLETASPATANRYLTALRRVLKEAWRLGYISAEEYQRAADVPSVKGERIPAGRELTRAEIRALMNDCISDKKQNTGTRDAAIIALMYAGGLRRDEVIGANNYDPTTGKLVIIGKRNKQRTVYINNGAADALEDWLDLRGDGPGPIFLAINKGDKIRPGKQLSPQAIYGMLAKRAENAKVRDFSPHDLRRTFISDLLDAGVDITTVSKMAGHASVNTTARYDRRPEETKRKAAELLHVPYKRRRD